MPEDFKSSLSQTAEMTTAGLNLIQQALSIYDNDLRLAVSNARFREMFDLPDHLITPGASFEDTIRHLVERGEYGPVDDVDEGVRIRVEQAQAFEPHYMERTRANGRTISVEGHPLPEGGWVTVYTDITEIKEQESLLRARSETLSDQLLSHAERLSQTNRELASTISRLEETRRSLTEMEARARLTTEMMPAHIAHIGPDQRYTFSNRRLSSIMPGRPERIIGLPIKDAVGSDAWRHLKPRLLEAYEGKASVFEFTDTGSGRRIRVAFTPDEHEKSDAGVYILSMDVTEEAQARAALAQTHKRELAAQLTSGLAHDFANLLTIILGLQSRLAKFDLPGEAQALINATQAAAKRGGTLLDRIAQMSGHRDPRPKPTKPHDFLNDIMILAGGSLPEQIALDLNLSIGNDPLLFDPGHLQDSLLNLILNARAAIGQESGRIELAARNVRDTWLEVTVNDTGPGFSEAALSQALDPFFTTKGEEGSGLGLSMAYDLTKSEGGKLQLSNTEAGAQVSIRLPLRRVKDDRVSRLVLLVEDSDEIRESVREMLIGMGHKVIEATTAEEGLSLAQVSGIEMILSDIMLAGELSGSDLLRAVADHGIEVPSFLMTSLPRGNAARKKAAARFPLISKPFTASELHGFLQGAGT